MRSSVGIRGLVLLLAAVLAAGCGTSSTPAPSPSGTPTGVAPIATTAASLATTSSPATPATSPSPAYADTLRIGVNLGGSRSWQPWIDLVGVPMLTFGRLVYAGLYRYDGLANAIPDLADGPCFVPGDDGKVIRCRIKETTFHDGTPLTADDVAYTYQIMRQPLVQLDIKEVRVVDPRTVDFVLPAVVPDLLTTVLPAIPIFSRHSIDEAVAVFDEATRGLTPEGLDKLADDINAEISADPPVCSEARLAEVEAIYRKLGYVIVYREDLLLPNGTIDTCGALGNGAWNLHTSTSWGGGSIGYALSRTGIDRVAAIVGQMAWGRPDIFVGTGPYRYVSQDADRVHFEAFDGYHGGRAATRYVDLVRAEGDGSDLVAGTVDIVPDTSLGTAFEATAVAHGVEVVHPPTPRNHVLTLNVREGRLFSDVNLRKALQLCIDLPRNVDAATGGTGIPIYSPVMPGTWPDDPDLPKPERDVAAAKRLIEASGWTLGADGIYAKDGVSLAAQVPVRGDAPDRVKMVDLITAQARDCGMDLKNLPVEIGDLQAMGDSFPHYIPGTKTPFDLTLAVWSVVGADPLNILPPWTSEEISDEEYPNGGNMGGFSDPAFDRLVEAGADTYDQAERTAIYRQAQEELAAQLPTIFLWAGVRYDSLRTAVTTVDGPLDLTVPNWAWQPERMVVTKGVQ